MPNPIILITGAGGFIGRNLVRHFQSIGWKVRALAHSRPSRPLAGVEYFDYSLEDRLDPEPFQAAQYLVHCAYLANGRKPDADEINFRGTGVLLAMCRRHAIHFVFLSSFSARAQAESHYGRIKLRIEGLLDPSLDLALRPGLVIGRGGLCGAIAQAVSRRRFLPLLGGGRQPVQTIPVSDLCRIVETGLRRSIRGFYNVADPVSITLRELSEMIAALQERKIWLVPIPIWPAYVLARAAEAAGRRLPISSDNILGAKHLSRLETRDDLKVFGAVLQPCREALRTALQAPEEDLDGPATVSRG